MISKVCKFLSDVILMSVGLNRVSNLYYSNPNRFKNIMRSEKLLRQNQLLLGSYFLLKHQRFW